MRSQKPTNEKSENHENMKIAVFVNSLKEPGPETMTMSKSSKSYADSFMDLFFRPNGALLMPLPSSDLLSSETRTPPLRGIFFPSESHGVTPWLAPHCIFFLPCGRVGPSGSSSMSFRLFPSASAEKGL